MKTIEQILQEIRPEVDFSKSDNFFEKPLLDSLDIIRLVAELDQNFAISIDGSEILPENFVNMSALVALVEKHKGGPVTYE